MSKRNTVWAGRALAVACLLTLTPTTNASGGEPAAEAAVIDILSVRFEPAETRVPVGTTIRWVNHDPFTHDVTSGVSILGREARQVENPKRPDGRFSSGLFGKDQTFTHTFDTKGEYPYYCNIHPFMVGTIIVE